MVLDEDALEAMLKQQKQQAEDGETKESKQTELTHQTEEFEVYEKEPGTPKTGKGLRADELDPDPAPAGITPEATQELAPEPETGPEPTPTPTPTPEPEPTPAPEATPEPETEAPTEPVLPEAFQDPPEPAPEPEPVPEPTPPAPAPEAPTATEDAPEPERPRVWPPLSGNNDGGPTVVEQEETAAPAQETIDDPALAQETGPEPTPPPTPTAEPEPAPEPTPVTEAATTTPDAAPDPHSHAHADLEVDGGGVRIAIVQALFNQDITDMMADLAVAKAKKRGAKVAHHVTVPGVYDLPLVTARLLEQDDVDCAVVIGVVVQGETSHDELITHATARTLQQLSLDVDKPIGFGVIGPGMTWKQAEARVANGAHAVDAALAQVEAIKTL